jgi:hypothetical protein
MSITVDTIYDREVLRPEVPVDLILNSHYSITINKGSRAALCWQRLGCPRRCIRLI